MKAPIWTIGHSTHPMNAFAALLRHHGIAIIADVRSLPGSRRFPHFDQEVMAEWLPEIGVRYIWLGERLGGRRRKTLEDSPNSGLRNASFRNYADHMLTADFSSGIDELLALADEAPTAVMCSELLWWRCHRSLIADYVALIRRRSVLHISGLGAPSEHPCREFVTAEGPNLFYRDAAGLAL